MIIFHKKDFDAVSWYESLFRAVEARGVSWVDVAKVTGVSSTTLSRLQSGRRPDAASLAALSAWAGINPAEFFKKP